MGFGITAGDDCPSVFGEINFQCANTTTAVWALGLVFGGLGAVIGHGTKSDGWEPVSLPSSSLANIKVRPTFRGSVGFTASIPFGQ